MNNIEVGMRVRVTLHHHVTDIDHETVPLYPLQLTQIGPRAFVTPWEPPIKVVATAGTIYEGVVDEVYSEPGENLFGYAATMEALRDFVKRITAAALRLSN